MIRYTEMFSATVKGVLSAQFSLDSDGHLIGGVDDGTTFYRITLSLVAPPDVRESINQVTYLLDQSTFWEPERVSRNREKNFAEEITSYGDFLLRVIVTMENVQVKQQALLSDLLEAGHPSAPPAIQQAIAYIRAN